jgi:hypothetical protein
MTTSTDERTRIECAIAAGLSDRQIAAAHHRDVGDVLEVRLRLDELVFETRLAEVVDLRTSAGRWKVIFDNAYPDSPATRAERRKVLASR